MEGSLKHRVFKSSFLNFSASLISKIGGLIFTIIIARILMPEGFGIYSLAISIALIFLTFADLGINQTMLRYVSAEIKENKKKAAAYFNYIFNIKIVVSLVISALIACLAYPFAYFIFNKPSLFLPLLFLSVYVCLYALEGFIESLFYIGDYVKYAVYKEFLLQVLKIVLILVFLAILSKSYYVLGVIWSLIISMIIIFIFVSYFARKLFKFLFIKPEIKIDKTKIIRFITYLTLGNLSGVFFSYVDTILLGIFVTAEYVGYYRASSNLVLAIAGLLSFIYVFLPILAVAHDKKLNYLFNKIIKYSFIITIPAAFGLMAIAKYAIVLIYGYPYLKAFSTLYFLSPVIVLMVNTSLFLILFSAKEKTKEFAKLNLFITILNIILNLVFISILVKSSQVWAISGAAAAIMLSWMIYYLLASIIAKRKLGVSVRFSSFFKPFIASIVMFMAISFFNSLVSDMNIFYGIATVVIGMLVYALILLLIKGIAKEDFYLLKNLIKS